MSRTFTATTDNLVNTSGCPVSTGPCTLSIWFKAVSLNNFRRAFTIYQTGGIYISLGSMASGACRGWVDNGAADEQPTTAATMSTGTWTHLALTTNGTNSHKSYIGGTASTAATGTSSPSGINKIVLGYNASIGDAPDGLIAHAAMWDIELSGANITSLAGGANPLAISASNLKEYWTLQQSGSGPLPGAVNGTTYQLTVTGATYSSDDPTVDAPPSSAVGRLTRSTLLRGGILAGRLT